MTNNVNRQNFSSQDLLGVGGGRRGNNDYFIGNRNGNTVTYALGFDSNGEWFEDFDIRGSYFYNSASNALDQLTNREYILGNNANQLHQRDFPNESSDFTTRVKLRIEYDIDYMNSLSMRQTLSSKNKKEKQNGE